MSTMVEAPGLDLAGYLAAVRAQLSDLGADEVDELTGGLEADLADGLAGSGAPPEEVFGSPVAYAAELRAAAGLPARAVTRQRAWQVPPGIRRRGADLGRWLDRQPWGADVRAFGVTVLPLWWAFRAYVVFQIVAQQFSGGRRWSPQGMENWALLLVLLVVSLEVGRRDWAGRTVWRRLLVGLVDLLAVLAILIAGYTAVGGTNTPDGPLPMGNGMNGTESVTFIETTPTNGFYNDGYRVRNIFPYDSEGKPIQGVQLFDDRGRMIEPAGTGYGRGENRINFVPTFSADGQRHWNVYPLRETVSLGYDEQGNPILGEPRDAKAPYRLQYPVIPVPATPDADGVSAASTSTEEK